MSIEEFSTQYEKTIQLVIAICTFLAVVISLVASISAKKAHRANIKCYLNKVFLFGGGISEKPEYMNLSVTNIGLNACRIPFSFFYWKLPFYSNLLLLHPKDGFPGDKYIQKKTYPHTVEPNHSETFFLSDLMVLKKEFRRIYLDYKKQWYGRLFPALFGYIKAYVVTDDGMRFRVGMSKEIKKYIKQSIKDESAQ